MVALTDAQLAARYQLRETQVAKKTHWKGCVFCKLPIQPKEEYKPGIAPFANACMPCVNKLAPPPPKPIVPPVEVTQLPIDCTPSSAPSDDLVKLLAEQTTLLRIERESTSKLQSENADLRAKNERLTIAMKHSDQLIDACLRVMEKEKVIASPAYQDERNEIRRVLVAMNRWTVNNK